MFKYDIINIFGRAHSMNRYLEICTPTTGNRFAYVDSAVWVVRHRLMYRCPGTFDDGLPFHFRTQSEGAHDLIRDLDEVLPKSERYDLIFVDPWHSYDAGILDLNGALCLLRPGGVIVVHDCNPTDPTIVGSDFKDGDWCGLTYQSFIDFVLAAQPAGYLVVDTDYGCGLVFTQGSPLPPGLPNARPAQRLIFEWCLARAKEETRFAFFERNRVQLLNLVSPEQFAAAFGALNPSTKGDDDSNAQKAPSLEAGSTDDIPT